MIEKLISKSIKNRLVVLIISSVLFAWGIYSVQHNPIDAIPDLSENQVIVYSEWMGRSPQINEVSTNLQSILASITLLRSSLR